MDGLDPLGQQGHRCLANQEGQDHSNTNSSHSTGLYKHDVAMQNIYTHKNCFNEQSTNDSSPNEANLQYASTTADTSPVGAIEQQQQHQGQLTELDYITTNDNENHFQQTGQFEQQNHQLGGLDSRMSDEDAFIDFCADSSSSLNNDSNRRYYINKLYQPLNNGTNNQNQHRSHQHLETDADSQLLEQDDEYLLYQELKFIESSAQKISLCQETTDLSKILEDDDGIEANLGKDHEDSLDGLQLTTIIESFDDFASSPLIDSCNGHDSLVMPSYSQVSTSNTNNQPNQGDCLNHERSSPINEHDMHDISFNPSISYNSSLDEHFNISETHHQHQHQEIFNDDYANQSVTSYSSDAQNVHSLNQNQHNNILTGEQQMFQLHDQNDHQDIGGNEMSNCIQLVSTPTLVDQNNVSSSGVQIDESTTYKNDSPATASNNNKKKRSPDDESYARKSNNKKLKKRRSTLSVAEKKNKQTIAASTSNNSSTDEHQMERIKELTSRLLNDEDESIVSDNNSMRSDSSRRNPIVSHYRRRTANARERIRMREINQAFEKLKKVVPIELVQQAAALENGDTSDQASASGGGRRKSSPSAGPSHQADSVKLTKITTLRLAVSYIAKLTEILNQNPEPSSSTNVAVATTKNQIAKAVCNQSGQAKEISVKTTRRSRSESKRSSQDKGSKKRLNKSDKEAKVDSSSTPQEDANQDKSQEPQNNSQINKPSQVIGHEQIQPSLIISNPSCNKTPDQPQQKPQQQQHQQTAFISIPNQQKQQYLTTYPNQQQLLISQPIGAGHERTLVTPVAVAILGIPTTNTSTQSTTNSNESGATQNIQLVGIQKSGQQQTIIGPQHPTYNLQIAQQQQPQQSRQLQQVTLTLDDMNGLSVLRLANPQVPNQSMPIQFRAISKQNHAIMQQQQQQPQQTQIFTTQNGVNYAFRPVQVQQTNNSVTTLDSSSTPTNFQQSMIRICNNQPANLISQSSNNIINNNSNNINSTSDNYLRQTQTASDGRAICNISQMGLLPSQFNHATFTTGTNSDQVSNISISKDATAVTQQQSENNQIQISQQPVNNMQQQQQQQQQQQTQNCITSKTMFIPTSNFMTFSANNQQYIQARPLSLQTQGSFSGDLQIGHGKTANLVYINPLPPAGGSNQQVQQRVCIVSDQYHESHSQMKYVQSATVQHSESFQQAQMNNRNEISSSRSMTRDKMQYVTHFNAQSDTCQSSTSEANINQLVASLATSIQPQNNNIQATTITSTSNTNANNDSQQRPQQQLVQQQQQQQPARTYRFHNYDGNMINSHLYGNNHHAQQQQSSKRAQLSKQQQQQENNVNKMSEQQQPQQHVATKQRSRQNSLSSICSTTSCSSSSLNYTSSTGGSPSNNAPVVSVVVSSSPVGCNNSLSMANDSPLMIEEGLLSTTSMPRSARVAT